MKTADELFEEWWNEHGWEDYEPDDYPAAKSGFLAGYKCREKKQANNNIHSYAPYTYQ